MTTFTCWVMVDATVGHRYPAPSTLSTFLRAFTLGRAPPPDTVAACVSPNLGRRAPLSPGIDAWLYHDGDDTVRATHGYPSRAAGSGTPASAA